MSEIDPNRIDKRVKIWLLVASLATLALLAAAALRENVFADWRRLRSEYADILDEKAADEQGRTVAEQFEIRIVQNYLPELRRTDRCITCHTGVDDPRMTDQPQPFTTHPGSTLQIHEPAKFGCTVCHRGQGLATETADAHGNVPHWDKPLLDRRFIMAACAQCHGEEDVYAAVGVDAGRPAEGDDRHPETLVALGKKLTMTKGCLGCHILRGRGGALGPEITYVGEKTKHDFDFSHISGDGPRTVEHWLKNHFLDPGLISPGTVMPDMGLTEYEAEALTAYMMSLRKNVEAASYHVPPGGGPEDTPHGESLYRTYCSSCHGEQGQASEVPGIRTPALNNSDSLAVAGDDYYRFIIAMGRSSTKMPAWREGDGNLSREDIDRIVDYIRAWEPEGADPGDVNPALGSVEMGRAYYHGLCANCHGLDGEGGVGNTLNSLTFLGAASDPFLAETIIHGRPGTAMPAWKELPAQAVSDILAYIRHWQPDAPTFEDVEAAMASRDPRSNASAGRAIYSANCGPCHGRNGEGGIGVRLNSPSVLERVDDRYLYQTITRGRPTTAMPAWKHLSADQVGAVIAFLRTWGTYRGDSGEAKIAAGDYSIGRVHYEVSCLGCHGENARGGIGPQLANPVLLRSVSNETLFQWIGHGRTGTAMEGFLPEEQGPTRLTLEHIADVIAYLRYEGSREERPILRTGIGNSALGSLLFEANCGSCHGRDGEGASGPQLSNPVFLRTASDGFLAATIALGRSGTPMRSMVRGHEGLGQIPPELVQDVIAFIRLWEYPEAWRKPRAVAEMSERSIRSGKDKFARYCSGCHGPNGRGEQDGAGYFAPAINNPEFLEAASDGFLLATIARGRSGTPMRPFGKASGGISALETGDLYDIVSYIRTWHEGEKEKGEQSL